MIIPPEILFALGIVSLVYYCDGIVNDYKTHGKLTFGLNNGLYGLLIPAIYITFCNGLLAINNKFPLCLDFIDMKVFCKNVDVSLTLVVYSVPFCVEKLDNVMDKIKLGTKLFLLMTLYFWN